jgi:hypothetical protein
MLLATAALAALLNMKPASAKYGNLPIYFLLLHLVEPSLPHTKPNVVI